MSVLTAVILNSMLITPIVQVSHDRVIETARIQPATPQQTQHLPVQYTGATDIGIDDKALTEFVEQANQRYQGF